MRNKELSDIIEGLEEVYKKLSSYEAQLNLEEVVITDYLVLLTDGERYHINNVASDECHEISHNEYYELRDFGTDLNCAFSTLDEIDLVVVLRDVLYRHVWFNEFIRCMLGVIANE